MTLDELVRAARGTRLGAPPTEWTFTGLSTDTRTVQVGDVFVALRGENFDGNDFIDDAIARGATVVVCHEGRALDRRAVAFVQTDDTLRALGDIAAAHRRAFAIPVVAITGSNGKTTTKELLRSILAVACGSERVLANTGNLNNLIGLPLTVMRLGPEHRVAILEMGMNAPGEIARLTEIAAPTHGLITSVAAAHLQGLGSIEGVAAAKAELFEGLGRDATGVVNLADAHVVAAARLLRGDSTVRYGPGGAVRAENVDASSIERIAFELVYGDAGEKGEVRRRVQLPIGGRHNVTNALAAAACAYALGVDADAVAEGLATAEPPPMRITIESLANGVRLINDAYNANPDSLKAALAALAEAEHGRTILALGEMLELGDRAGDLHCQAGRDAAALQPVLLCAMGQHAGDVCTGAREGGLAHGAAVAAEGQEEVARLIARVWQAGDTVLIKGSRGAQMERVAEVLRGLATA